MDNDFYLRRRVWEQKNEEDMFTMSKSNATETDRHSGMDRTPMRFDDIRNSSSSSSSNSGSSSSSDCDSESDSSSSSSGYEYKWLEAKPTKPTNSVPTSVVVGGATLPAIRRKQEILVPLKSVLVILFPNNTPQDLKEGFKKLAVKELSEEEAKYLTNLLKNNFHNNVEQFVVGKQIYLTQYNDNEKACTLYSLKRDYISILDTLYPKADTSIRNLKTTEEILTAGVKMKTMKKQNNGNATHSTKLGSFIRPHPSLKKKRPHQRKVVAEAEKPPPCKDHETDSKLSMPAKNSKEISLLFPSAKSMITESRNNEVPDENEAVTRSRKKSKETSPKNCPRHVVLLKHLFPENEVESDDQKEDNRRKESKASKMREDGKVTKVEEISINQGDSSSIELSSQKTGDKNDESKRSVTVNGGSESTSALHSINNQKTSQSNTNGVDVSNCKQDTWSSMLSTELLAMNGVDPGKMNVDSRDRISGNRQRCVDENNNAITTNVARSKENIVSTSISERRVEVKKPSKKSQFRSSKRTVTTVRNVRNSSGKENDEMANGVFGDVRKIIFTSKSETQTNATAKSHLVGNNCEDVAKLKGKNSSKPETKKPSKTSESAKSNGKASSANSKTKLSSKRSSHTTKTREPIRRSCSRASSVASHRGNGILSMAAIQRRRHTRLIQRSQRCLQTRDRRMLHERDNRNSRSGERKRSSPGKNKERSSQRSSSEKNRNRSRSRSTHSRDSSKKDDGVKESKTKGHSKSPISTDLSKTQNGRDERENSSRERRLHDAKDDYERNQFDSYQTDVRRWSQRTYYFVPDYSKLKFDIPEDIYSPLSSSEADFGDYDDDGNIIDPQNKKKVLHTKSSLDEARHRSLQVKQTLEMNNSKSSMEGKIRKPKRKKENVAEKALMWRKMRNSNPSMSLKEFEQYYESLPNKNISVNNRVAVLNVESMESILPSMSEDIDKLVSSIRKECDHKFETRQGKHSHDARKRRRRRQRSHSPTLSRPLSPMYQYFRPDIEFRRRRRSLSPVFRSNLDGFETVNSNAHCVPGANFPPDQIYYPPREYDMRTQDCVAHQVGKICNVRDNRMLNDTAHNIRPPHSEAFLDYERMQPDIDTGSKHAIIMHDINALSSMNEQSGTGLDSECSDRNIAPAQAMQFAYSRAFRPVTHENTQPGLPYFNRSAFDIPSSHESVNTQPHYDWGNMQQKNRDVNSGDDRSVIFLNKNGESNQEVGDNPWPFYSSDSSYEESSREDSCDGEVEHLMFSKLSNLRKNKKQTDNKKRINSEIKSNSTSENSVIQNDEKQMKQNIGTPDSKENDATPKVDSPAAPIEKPIISQENEESVNSDNLEKVEVGTNATEEISCGKLKILETEKENTREGHNEKCVESSSPKSFQSKNDQPDSCHHSSQLAINSQIVGEVVIENDRTCQQNEVDGQLMSKSACSTSIVLQVDPEPITEIETIQKTAPSSNIFKRVIQRDAKSWKKKLLLKAQEDTRAENDLAEKSIPAVQKNVVPVDEIVSGTDATESVDSDRKLSQANATSSSNDAIKSDDNDNNGSKGGNETDMPQCNHVAIQNANQMNVAVSSATGKSPERSCDLVSQEKVSEDGTNDEEEKIKKVDAKNQTDISTTIAATTPASSIFKPKTDSTASVISSPLTIENAPPSTVTSVSDVILPPVNTASKSVIKSVTYNRTVGNFISNCKLSTSITISQKAPSRQVRSRVPTLAFRNTFRGPQVRPKTVSTDHARSIPTTATTHTVNFKVAQSEVNTATTTSLIPDTSTISKPSPIVQSELEVTSQKSQQSYDESSQMSGQDVVNRKSPSRSESSEMDDNQTSDDAMQSLDYANDFFEWGNKVEPTSRDSVKLLRFSDTSKASDSVDTSPTCDLEPALLMTPDPNSQSAVACVGSKPLRSILRKPQRNTMNSPTELSQFTVDKPASTSLTFENLNSLTAVNTAKNTKSVTVPAVELNSGIDQMDIVQPADQLSTNTESQHNPKVVTAKNRIFPQEPIFYKLGRSDQSKTHPGSETSPLDTSRKARSADPASTPIAPSQSSCVLAEAVTSIIEAIPSTPRKRKLSKNRERKKDKHQSKSDPNKPKGKRGRPSKGTKGKGNKRKRLPSISSDDDIIEELQASVDSKETLNTLVPTENVFSESEEDESDDGLVSFMKISEAEVDTTFDDQEKEESESDSDANEQEQEDNPVTTSDDDIPLQVLKDRGTALLKSNSRKEVISESQSAESELGKQNDTRSEDDAQKDTLEMLNDSVGDDDIVVTKNNHAEPAPFSKLETHSRAHDGDCEPQRKYLRTSSDEEDKPLIKLKKELGERTETQSANSSNAVEDLLDLSVNVKHDNIFAKLTQEMEMENSVHHEIDSNVTSSNKYVANDPLLTCSNTDKLSSFSDLFSAADEPPQQITHDCNNDGNEVSHSSVLQPPTSTSRVNTSVTQQQNASGDPNLAQHSHPMHPILPTPPSSPNTNEDSLSREIERAVAAQECNEEIDESGTRAQVGGLDGERGHETASVGTSLVGADPKTTTVLSKNIMPEGENCHGFLEVCMSAPGSAVYSLRRIPYVKTTSRSNDDAAHGASNILPASSSCSTYLRLRDVITLMKIQSESLWSLICRCEVNLYYPSPFSQKLFQMIYDPVCFSDAGMNKLTLRGKGQQVQQFLDKMIILDEFLHTLLPRFYLEALEIPSFDVPKFVNVKIFKPIFDIDEEVVKVFRKPYEYNAVLETKDDKVKCKLLKKKRFMSSVTKPIKRSQDRNGKGTKRSKRKKFSSDNDVTDPAPPTANPVSNPATSAITNNSATYHVNQTLGMHPQGFYLSPQINLNRIDRMVRSPFYPASFSAPPLNHNFLRQQCQTPQKHSRMTGSVAPVSVPIQQQTNVITRSMPNVTSAQFTQSGPPPYGSYGRLPPLPNYPNPFDFARISRPSVIQNAGIGYSNSSADFQHVSPLLPARSLPIVNDGVSRPEAQEGQNNRVSHDNRTPMINLSQPASEPPSDRRPVYRDIVAEALATEVGVTITSVFSLKSDSVKENNADQYSDITENSSDNDNVVPDNTSSSLLTTKEFLMNASKVLSKQNRSDEQEGETNLVQKLRNRNILLKSSLSGTKETPAEPPTSTSYDIANDEYDIITEANSVRLKGVTIDPRNKAKLMKHLQDTEPGLLSGLVSKLKSRVDGKKKGGVVGRKKGKRKSGGAKT